MTHENKKPLINIEDGHLSDEGVAFCAEKLVEDEDLNNVSEELRTHLSDCFDCKKKVIEIADLIEQLNDIIEKTNPNFLDDVAPEYAEEVEREEREREREREKEEREKENETVVEEVRKQKFKINKYSYLAAASIVIIIISITLFTLFSKQSNEQLFNYYFAPYPDIITEKGEFKSDNMLENVMYYYNTADYAMVVEMLENCIENDASDYFSIFYYGISCMKTGNPKDAIMAFKKLYEKKIDPLRYQTAWYLGLAYLQNNEREKAINVFGALSEMDISYSEKAEELLKKLE
ncbi:MAG: hypothetical protein JEY97_16085 [Bacteroidales bacterium]|nr:hypothetical protein [Bacteroidales bacterium]